MTKNGGNVASHFLTADGRVIHSVTGPVSAEALLQEAQWALDVYAAAQAKPASQRAALVAWSHQQASLYNFRSNQDRQVHQLLMQCPLAPLVDVYQQIFEEILGQRVSTAAPRLQLAAEGLERARKSGRPLLFILHEGNGSWSPPAAAGGAGGYSQRTQQLMSEYVTIVMPLREGPALSQLTRQPPFEAVGTARPLFVIARSDCTQLASVAGWNDAQLAYGLAAGWVDALERNPPSVRDLARASRALDKFHAGLAQRVRELTIRQKEAQDAASE